MTSTPENVKDRAALIVSTSFGTETDEILGPLKALQEAGVATTVAVADGEKVQTLVMDREPGPVVPGDVHLSEVDPDAFDILVVPGGTLNADTLRTDLVAQRLVKDFAGAGKPVAAICHAPWLLVSTDLVVGKTVTSYGSLSVDVTNAGGNWVDEEVVVDTTNGFTLITSRTPEDLKPFCDSILKALA